MNHPIEALLSVIDTLLGPNGCPWDREQTLKTWTPMIVEEAAESMDALFDGDLDHYADELGDLLITVFFACKVLEKSSSISWDVPIKNATEKLIRRHPHVFSTATGAHSVEAVIDMWDSIKKEERFQEKKQAASHVIPKNLPIVARWQKVVSKAKKEPLFQKALETVMLSETKSEAKDILHAIVKAEKKGIDVESSLRELFVQFMYFFDEKIS